MALPMRSLESPIEPDDIPIVVIPPPSIEPSLPPPLPFKPTPKPNMKRPSPKQPVKRNRSPASEPSAPIKKRDVVSSPINPQPQSSTPVQPTPEKQAEPSDLVRLPQKAGSPSLMSTLLGTNTQNSLLETNLERLSDSLDYRPDKPVSDAQRAARSAQRMLEEDLAQDSMSAGMADDYFRVLKETIELRWDPTPKELNDAGGSVGRVSMMRDAVERRAAWGEVFKVYLELAEQYGNGLKPKLEPKRRAQLREMFRSRKGNFKVVAIAEFRLTQDEKGNILTLHPLTPSGHPQFDRRAIDAIASAVTFMPPPPRRLSLGRSFSSDWRMRATWRMIPPTALLTGSSFDVSAKGVEMDMPFEMKRRTNTMLLNYDNRQAHRHRNER